MNLLNLCRLRALVSLLALVGLAYLSSAIVVTAAPDRLPDFADDFIVEYCVDCHDSATKKGDLNLEVDGIDWLKSDERKHWSYLHMMVDRNKMPPKNKRQPSMKARKAFLAWLDGKLMKHSPIGGTPMRRLNGREYIESIERIFSLKSFTPPPGFPSDSSTGYFDNLGATLMISPTHMEAYAESATMIADKFFPPENAPVQSRKYSVSPDDMTISYSSGMKFEGAMRLAASGSKERTAIWPSKFEAPVSGTYHVKVKVASKKASAGHRPILAVGASALEEGKDKLRSLHLIEIKSESPHIYDMVVDLYQGETLVFQYENAPYNFQSKKKYEAFLKQAFKKRPRLAAAWLAAGKASKSKGRVPRGGIGWQRVKASLKRLKPEAKVSQGEIDTLIKSMVKSSIGTGETLIYHYFEEGPNLGIYQVAIEGPAKLIMDPRKMQDQKERMAFLGEFAGKKDDAAVRRFLTIYLAKVYRRPVTDHEIEPYIDLIKGEMSRGLKLNDGLHLVIRTSLMSPDFLYREGLSGTGKLTDHELASRLSYFLASAPPDAKLMAKANQGQLAEGVTLRQQALALIKQASRSKFIQDFTSQWLDTDQLDVLMPDPSVFRDFNSKHVNTLKQEVEMTFEEILMRNRPVIDFINPDFIYTDAVIGKQVYQLSQFAKKSAHKKTNRNKKNKSDEVLAASIAKQSKIKLRKTNLKRITIPRDTRHGGLLSMSAVMAATANGVDTEPVLRGVWVLENIIGTPPPHPPKGVPALTPDTTGTLGPREQLAAHMADPNCASCHEDIDPVGFILENHDPIGRWRTHYPASKKAKADRNKKVQGLPVDSSGVLPTGEKLKDVTDLKKWLAKNPELFASCIARKLMTYAAGRELNYREKKFVNDIAIKNVRAGKGFQDLILDLVDSDVFRAR